MKSQRLFEILLYMIEKRDVTASQLATHFHVSLRTIYRDVDALSLAGIPIYTTAGKQGGIHLLENYMVNKTLLTSEEQENVLVALKTLQSLPFFSFNPTITKISSHISPDKQGDSWLEINFSHWNDPDFFKNQLFSVIKENIILKNRLQIKYVNLKGEHSKRTVEPLKLVFKERDWYLYAFCLLKNEFRFFKVLRIISAQPLKETCIHDYQAYSHLAQSSSPAKMNHPFHFSGIFLSDCAHYIYDMLPQADITYISDHEIRVNADVNEDEWLYSFLLFLGPKIKQLDPPELAEKIRKLHLDAASSISFQNVSGSGA